MKQISTAKINTLKAVVMAMSQFELKLTLITILDGFDIDVAIDIAATTRSKHTE